MRKALAITLLVTMVLPSMGFAGGWRRHRYREHYRPYPRTSNVYNTYHNNGGAIAAGVLGGIVTGVMLDRLLTPRPQQPPRPVCCQGPASYYPPAPTHSGYGDPYDRGYQQGYQQGVARGRAERYEQGKNQGYDQGLDDAASGRIWASTSP